MTKQKNEKRPEWVNWDLTYACPLRCIHCYSESGRRASRQLSLEQMRQVAEAIIAAKPRRVQLSGGEPLLVSGLLELAERFVANGIPVALYTSGWLLTEAMLPALAAVISRIHVSLDAATAPVHDAIRGRNGSFDRALNALHYLNEYTIHHSSAAQKGWEFGIDYVIVQSNFHEMERLCESIVPRFQAISFVNLDAAVPSGLASRKTFAQTELLTEAQLAMIRDPAFAQRLRAPLPGTVELRISDGQPLRMHPEDLQSGAALSGLAHVEPDGALRCHAIYEGTVGNLLEEPFEKLWPRVLQQRWDAMRVRELSMVRDMQSWATAARHIDWHYGSRAVRDRILRRNEYIQIAKQATVPG